MTKGQQAYEHRLSGASWKTVASKVGCPTQQAAVHTARKYALRGSLPWPIKTTLHHRREQVAARAASRAALADADIYRQVAGGTAITKVTGPPPSPHQVYRAIDRHVERTGDPPLPRNNEHAYVMRVNGTPWSEIVATLGYSCVSHAIEAARRFAQREGKAWPIKNPGNYSGKAFYDAAVAGESWPDIARTQHRSPHGIIERAQIYAEAFDLKWPVPPYEEHR